MNVYFNYNKPTRSVHNPHFVVEEQRLRKLPGQDVQLQRGATGIQSQVHPASRLCWCRWAVQLSSCASIPVLGKTEPHGAG